MTAREQTAALVLIGWCEWRARGQRGEHPCDRCPIVTACTAPLPGGRLTLEAVREAAARVEAAFEALP